MSLLGALATLAAPDDDRPPVAFTAPGDTGVPLWGSATTGRKQQLDMTTAETTMFSVLDLISSRVAAAPWQGERPAPPGRARDAEPVIVTGEQNLAVKLWNKPNAFTTGSAARKVMTWHYASVGEAWAVIRYADKAHTIPLSWWWVQPNRMFPIPHPEKFLTGYIYVAPSGERVPLDLDQVVRITNPHPTDPHRGIGVVQTLGTATGLALSSAEWIAAFFRNDATPGGVIEIPEGLNDDEFVKLRKRWNEQHRGVNRAHRVAILEYGKWVARTSSLKDMQFTELRGLSRDQILEGFRVHKHMLGASDDVNRANAEAGLDSFAETTTDPLLQVWRAFADGPYRDRFGPAGQLVTFTYTSPIKGDPAEERAETTGKVDNVVKLVGAGFDPDAACEAMGLAPIAMKVEPAAPEPVVQDQVPDAGGDTNLLDAANVVQKLYLAVDGNTFLTELEARDWAERMGAPIDAANYVKPDPQPEPAPVAIPGAGQAIPKVMPGEEPTAPTDRTVRTSTVAARVQAEGSPAADVDLSQLDAEWQAAVEAALSRWQADVLPAQYADLVGQVQDAVDAGDYDKLADLVAPTDTAEAVLVAAMIAMGGLGAASVTREAAAQGVHAAPTAPGEGDLSRYARVAVAVLAATVAASAAKEALRLAGPAAIGVTVAAVVRQHLDALSSSFVREVLAAALTVAQNMGRAVTMAAAPPAGYYASEVLDTNTCAPCRAINGRHLGDHVDSVYQDYPTGGYVDCLGRDRCRGVVVAVWKDNSDA